MSVPGAVPGARGAGAGPTGGALAARVALGALFVLSTAVSVGWLLLGAVAAAAQYWPAVARSVAAADAAGSTWARAIAAAAPASEPLSQAVLDYGFSLLNLVLAVVLLGAGVRRPSMRTWPIRLLAVALVGSAGAFNLQAHAAARAIETATGLVVTELHQVVLHSIACAAYILALLLFPSPSWDGLPGARPARGALAVVGAVTFLLVGLGTALLPHTTSCVLFFGFLVPAVGLVVLPRRVRRGPGAEARTQARLLFSTLVGGFAVAIVLGIVTVLLDVLGETPALTLVDPTAHGAPPRRPDRAAVLVLPAGVGRDRGRRAGRHPARPAVDRRALVQPRARGAARDVGRGRRVRRAARDRRRRARRHGGDGSRRRC